MCLRQYYAFKMHHAAVLLIAIAGVSLSAYLPPGPDPVEWYEKEQAQAQESQVSKRQIPFYLPVITIPQIVEVHHVVILQSPDLRCYPRVPPTPPAPRPPVTTTPVPTPTGDDDLFNKMGGDNNATAPMQPSRCVWAIVACCSPGSSDIRYTCFELLGCQGAFWDVNPCDSRVTMAAANTALKFYMSNSTSTRSNFDDVASNFT